MQLRSTGLRLLPVLLLASGAAVCAKEATPLAGSGTSGNPVRVREADSPEAAVVAPVNGKVEVAAVKYAGLTEAIKKEKGKVLVVDVWALY